MDKLAAMRAFVEIVDRGSLSAAGIALGRSLPTMVRSLAALEKALGVTLLRRTTRRRERSQRSICMPSSTTRSVGKPKYAVAGRALREVNAKSALRQRIILAVPVVSSVSRPM